jgi:hypothetical protein
METGSSNGRRTIAGTFGIAIDWNVSVFAK